MDEQILDRFRRNLERPTGTHFVVVDRAPCDLRGLLPSARWQLYDWSLKGCTTAVQFFAATNSTFGFTESVSNLDVLLDDITDPDFMTAVGAVSPFDRMVFVIRDLEELLVGDRHMFDGLMHILDRIVDGWRGQVERFHIVVLGTREICDAGEPIVHADVAEMQEAKREMRWGPLTGIETAPIFRYDLK